jgi:hypothetical protein
MKVGTFIYAIIIGFCMSFTVVDAHGQMGFNMADFKAAITARIKSTGARDTITSRVPAGQSCVEASEARAGEIAVVVKSMQANGKFGLLGAKVGRMSGWNPLSIVSEETRKKYLGETASGSMHTYTVVQLYDANGKVWFTIDADNYLGPIYVSEHGAVDWNADHTKLIEDVPPVIRSVHMFNPPAAFVGDNVLFQVSVDAAPWVKGNLRFKWMYVGGVKVLGQGESLNLRVDRATTYNLKAIVYNAVGGKEIPLAEATGSTIVALKPVIPTAPAQTTTAPTGRGYTSRPGGQTGGNAAAPSVDPANPVQGVVDVFKKVGGFFGK